MLHVHAGWMLIFRSLSQKKFIVEDGSDRREVSFTELRELLGRGNFDLQK